MSQIRQSELLASQDWKALYRAFSQINFNASDPTTINQALREYLRTNYPEDFNDWIESSEFVAIIDLLSWLAGTLAFKIDINARENFLETASARESVLRLARFLSYNPSRNRPATGLVKIVEVSSDDDVFDAAGRNLSGQRIAWNNPDDPDWHENFLGVLNAAFTSTNPFGTPLKSGEVGEVPTQLYRVNTRAVENDFRFSARINGSGTDFELCNGDFEDAGVFQERTPDQNAAFHLFFRNDSNGNGSSSTGFFMLFKQGSLRRQLFTIANPVENQLLEIETSGVTEDDVWVQTLNDDGNVLINWKRVPALFSENITFNSMPIGERDIYSVITRDDDRIAVRFSDGIFGTAPSGTVSVNYRVGNGLQYVIKPLDIERITQTISYINRRGVRRTLRLVFSNYDTVSNSVPRETEAQIKRRAPAVYSTQSRMVSGEDYNSFPLNSNMAVKLKAVNRVYAGHSRHIDMNDPTSTYQDTNVLADDGAIYVETSNVYEEVPITLNRSPLEMVEQHIQPMLRQTEVRDQVISTFIERAMTTGHPLAIAVPTGTWNQCSVAKYSSTGWFSAQNNFKVGSTILFQTPSKKVWATVSGIDGSQVTAPAESGLRGPVTLSEAIPTGSTMLAHVPAYITTVSSTVSSEIQNQIDLGVSFTLWYNSPTATWLVRNYERLMDATSPPSGYPSAIKVLVAESANGQLWRLSGRGTRIVFESMRKVKWYHNPTRVSDSKTGARKFDTVSVLGSNPNPVNGLALGENSVFATDQTYYYGNGTHEPRRIKVTFVDQDEDGGFDNPDAYLRLVNTDHRYNSLFWQLGDAFGSPSYLPVYNLWGFDTTSQMIATAGDTVNRLGYVEDFDKFYKWNGSSWVEQTRRNYKIAHGRGPNTAVQWRNSAGWITISVAPLYFHWKHFAQTNHRIDPAISNIIDIFVLSSEYDFLTRQWIAAGARAEDLPAPPTELDLRLTFKSYEEFKMFSDEIVWRPVRYKFLFGAGAEDTNLRAKFKVVKLPNTTMADGEIKSRVIRAINQFFDVTRWDFGQSFYFTELAAYVHVQLAGVIGSFVIVPQDEEASFGDVFEVSSASDEIFVSTAQVADVEIIGSNTSANLRIR